MKKSEAKSQQSAGELEAPVRLTPEQLEIVAAGFAKQLLATGGKGIGGATTGAIGPMLPLLKMF
jgi:hypothetical protein